METRIEKQKNSSYRINLLFTAEEFSRIVIDKGAQSFDENISLNMKELDENVAIEMFGEMLKIGMEKITQEHPNIKFIGKLYDAAINMTKEGDAEITVSLDVFPEVKILNAEWEKITLDTILPVAVSKKAISKKLSRLEEKYRISKEVLRVSKKALTHIDMILLDANKKVLYSTDLYTSGEDSDDFWDKTFWKRSRGEVIEIAYNKDAVPLDLLLSDDDDQVAEIDKSKIKTVVFEILDSEEFAKVGPKRILKKEFGVNVKENVKENLEKHIKESIEKKRFEKQLLKNVDDYLIKVIEKSMEVEIPKTIIDQEFNSRMENLYKRFGSEDGVEKYIKRVVGSRFKEIFFKDLKRNAEQSLRKHFTLEKVCECFGIDTNGGNNKMRIEKELYKRLRR